MGEVWGRWDLGCLELMAAAGAVWEIFWVFVGLGCGAAEGFGPSSEWGRGPGPQGGLLNLPPTLCPGVFVCVARLGCLILPAWWVRVLGAAGPRKVPLLRAPCMVLAGGSFATNTIICGQRVIPTNPLVEKIQELFTTGSDSNLCAGEAPLGRLLD